MQERAYLAASDEQWLRIPFDDRRCVVEDPQFRWLQENGWIMSFCTLMEEEAGTRCFCVRMERKPDERKWLQEVYVYTGAAAARWARPGEEA